MSPTLVTKSALTALDGADIRYTVVDSDPERTTLTFDHEALDALAELVGEGPRHDCTEHCDHDFDGLVDEEDLAVAEKLAASRGELLELYRKATGLSEQEVRDACAG